MNKHIKYIIEKNYQAFNPANLEDNKPKKKLPQDVVKQILYLKAKNPENLREHIKYLFDLGIKDLNCIDVSSIVDFSLLFRNMTDLQDLQIDEWDVSNGLQFESMFAGRLPNVYDVTYMFVNCEKFDKSCVKKWGISTRTQGYYSMG